MNRARLAVPLLMALLAAFGSSAAFGQLKRPGPPTPWNLFGAPQAGAKARDATTNRRGNRPNTERQPPLKRIGDPSNLNPEVGPGVKQPEPIKVAAQVKTEQDLKQQKIKGLKFLGTVGCGCYAKKYDIEGAFLAGLEDCDEEVRYEAVKAIMSAACGDVCKVCNMNNCCTEKIVAKLAEMAYKQDKDGCWVEPSARVRSAAVAALNSCQPHLRPEAGRVEPRIEGTGPRPAPGAVDPAPKPEAGGPNGSNRRNAQSKALPASVQQPAGMTPWGMQPTARPGQPSAGNSTNRSAKPSTAQASANSTKNNGKTVVHGSVSNVDSARRLVQVSLKSKQTLPVGTKLRVMHTYLSGKTELTQLEIQESSSGSAIASPLDMTKFAKVSKGDEIVILQ